MNSPVVVEDTCNTMESKAIWGLEEEVHNSKMEGYLAHTLQATDRRAVVAVIAADKVAEAEAGKL